MKITKMFSVILSILMLMSCFSFTASAQQTPTTEIVAETSVEEQAFDGGAQQAEAEEVASALEEEASEEAAEEEIIAADEEDGEEQVVLAEVDEEEAEESFVELLSEEDYVELLGADDWHTLRTALGKNLYTSSRDGLSLEYDTDEETNYRYVRITPVNTAVNCLFDITSLSVPATDSKITFKMLVRTNVATSGYTTSPALRTAQCSGESGSSDISTSTVTEFSYPTTEDWTVLSYDMSLPETAVYLNQFYIWFFGNNVQGDDVYTALGEETAADLYIDVAAWGFAISESEAADADVTDAAGVEKTVITFDYHNGTTSKFSDYPASYTDYADNVITFPETPTWEGHTFEGWSTALHGTVIEDTSTIPVPDAATTYYAVWSIDEDAQTVEAENAVYISSTGCDTCNNGRSAAFPYRSLATANNALNDSDTINTIYVVGTWESNVTSNNPIGDPDKKTYLLGYDSTAFFNNYDENKTYGKLQYLIGDLEIDNLKIKMENTYDGKFVTAGYDLVIGEGVTTDDSKSQLSLDYYNKGKSNNKKIEDEIVVKAGEFQRLYLNAMTDGVHYGKRLIKIDGTASVERLGTAHGNGTATQQFYGEANVEINGGTVKDVRWDASGKASIHNGLRYVKFNGGTTTNLYLRPNATDDTISGYSVYEINKGATVTNINTGTGDDEENVIVIFNDGATRKTISDTAAVVLDVTGANISADVTATPTQTVSDNTYTYSCESTLNGYKYSVTDSTYKTVTITNAAGKVTVLEDETDGSITPDQYEFSEGTTTVVFSPEPYYNVTWVNGDTTTTESVMPSELTAPAFSKRPTKDGYYTFKAWTVDDVEVDIENYPLTEDTTFVATYTTTAIDQSVDYDMAQTFYWPSHQKYPYNKPFECEVTEFKGISAAKITPYYDGTTTDSNGNIVNAVISVEGYDKLPTNWSTGEYVNKINPDVYDYVIIKYYNDNGSYTPADTIGNKMEWWVQGIADTGTATIGSVYTEKENGKWSYAVFDLTSYHGYRYTNQWHLRPWTKTATMATVANKDAVFYVNSMIYTMNEPTIATVTFVNGETTLYAIDVLNGEAAVYYGDIPESTESGYSFIGWSTASDATEARSTLEGFETDTTLYPVFSKDKAIVTWNDGVDDTTDAQVSYEIGATLALPADPTREGYKFIGWATTEGSTTADVTEGIEVTASVTYYAVWEEIIVTEVYVDNNKGSDDTGDGTAEKPVKTIVNAYSLFDFAEDRICTLYIVGDYSENVSGADKTVQLPTHSGMLIWKGTNGTTDESGRSVVTSTRALLGGDVTFDNIYFASTSESAVATRGHNFVLDGNSEIKSGGANISVGDYGTSTITDADFTYTINSGTLSANNGIALAMNYPNNASTQVNTGNITAVVNGGSTGVIRLAHGVWGGEDGTRTSAASFNGTLKIIVNDGTTGAIHFGNGMGMNGLRHVVVNGGNVASLTTVGSLVTNTNATNYLRDNSVFVTGVNLIEINGGEFTNKTISSGLSTATMTAATSNGTETVASGDTAQMPTNLTRVVIFNNGMADGFTVSDTGAIVVKATTGGKAEAITTTPTADNSWASELEYIKLTADEYYCIHVNGEKVEDSDGVYQLAVEEGTTYNVEFVTTIEYVTLTYTTTYGTAPEAQTVAKGTAVALGTITDTVNGYLFGGWKIGGATYEANTSYTVDADTTATAIWNEDASVARYTITWDNNDGVEGNEQTITYISGNTLVLPEITKEKYTLVGWATTADATEADVTAETAITADVTFYAIWVKSFENAVYISNDGDDTNDGLSADKPIKSLTRADALFEVNTNLNTLAVISYRKNNEGNASVTTFGVTGKKLYITGCTSDSVFDMGWYGDDGTSTSATKDSHLKFAGDVEFFDIAIKGSNKDGGFVTQGNKFTYGENVTVTESQSISVVHYDSYSARDSLIDLNSGTSAKVHMAMFSGMDYYGKSVINIGSEANVNVGIFNGHNYGTSTGMYGIFEVNINGGTVKTVSMGATADAGITPYAGLRYFTLNDGSVTGNITLTGSSVNAAGTLTSGIRDGVTVVEINKSGVLGGKIVLGTNKNTKSLEDDDATRVVIFNNNSYEAGKVEDDGAIVINAVNGTIKAKTTEAYADGASAEAIEAWAKTVELEGFAYEAPEGSNKVIITDANDKALELALDSDTGVLPIMKSGVYSVEFATAEEEIQTASITVTVNFPNKRGATVVSIAAMDLNGIVTDNIEVVENTETSITYTIGNLILGKTYSVVANKNGYVAGSYSAELKQKENTLEFTLLAGDIKGSFKATAGDGAVDIFDFLRLLRGFSASASAELKAVLDIDEDGEFKVDDLTYVKSNYGKKTSNVSIVFNGTEIAQSN